MTRFGIVATQSGRDVDSATDYDQVVSSFWPSVRTAITGRLTRTLTSPYNQDLSSDDYPKIKHGLGYTPMFYYFDGVSTTVSAIKSDATGVTRSLLAADEQYLYWLFPGFGGPGPASIAIDFYYVICPIDITTNFSAPTSNTGESSQGALGDIGLRIVENTNDITSSKLGNFIVSSDARSPSIHQIIYGKTDASGNASIAHGLPYEPMFLAYTTAYNNSTAADKLGLVNGTAALNTPPKHIDIVGAIANSPYSVVILKDPFLLGENITKVKI